MTEILPAADIAEREPSSSVDRIISKEAEYYFTGEKSLEEVVEIINNRVGLYLEEYR